MVHHHLDPVASLNAYAPSQAVLPSRADLDAIDFAVMDDPALVADIAAANELAPWAATDEEVADILAFLHALTDPAMLDLRADVPPSLPSGLPLFD
jgi:cytochrome c peroxidase